jgi:hypothetical protein
MQKDRSSDVQVPVPVDEETWSKRRAQFRLIEGRAFHTTGWQADLDERAYVLERELERCFVNGAWLACIVLATAIVEASIGHNNGRSQTCRDKNTWLIPILLPSSCVTDLKAWRNSLLHLNNNKYPVTEEQYLHQESELEERAHGACLLGLTALFLTGECTDRSCHETVLRQILEADREALAT